MLYTIYDKHEIKRLATRLEKNRMCSNNFAAECDIFSHHYDANYHEIRNSYPRSFFSNFHFSFQSRSIGVVSISICQIIYRRPIERRIYK